MAQLTFNDPGLYLIGNFTNNTIDISAANTFNIISVKTIINGEWKSWNRDADPSFNGINQYEPGRGYIIDCDNSAIIDFQSDDLIDIMSIPVILGNNLLASPVNMPAGINDRYTPKEIKTLVNFAWESWHKDAPASYNGVSTLEQAKGYYVNIIEYNQSIKELIGKDIPEMITLPPLTIERTDDTNYYIQISSPLMDIISIYVVDYGEIYSGWIYDTNTGILDLPINNSFYSGDLTGREAIILANRAFR